MEGNFKKSLFISFIFLTFYFFFSSCKGGNFILMQIASRWQYCNMYLNFKDSQKEIDNCCTEIKDKKFKKNFR